jgi:hypothetical protein
MELGQLRHFLPLVEERSITAPGPFDSPRLTSAAPAEQAVHHTRDV